MRVGFLSDTHIPVAPVLFPEILERFQGVDVILHAGDIVLARVLDQLQQVAPVFAAQGNHDGHLADDPRVKPVQWLDLNGFTVAVLHAFEPWDVGRSVLSPRLLDGGWADVIISGDSHLEGMEVVDGALCINAGSATMPRNRAPSLGHIGFLTLEQGRPPHAELYHLGQDPNTPILEMDGTMPTGEFLGHAAAHVHA